MIFFFLAHQLVAAKVVVMVGMTMMTKSVTVERPARIDLCSFRAATDRCGGHDDDEDGDDAEKRYSGKASAP